MLRDMQLNAQRIAHAELALQELVMRQQALMQVCACVWCVWVRGLAPRAGTAVFPAVASSGRSAAEAAFIMVHHPRPILWLSAHAGISVARGLLRTLSSHRHLGIAL